MKIQEITNLFSSFKDLAKSLKIPIDEDQAKVIETTLIKLDGESSIRSKIKKSIEEICLILNDKTIMTGDIKTGSDILLAMGIQLNDIKDLLMQGIQYDISNQEVFEWYDQLYSTISKSGDKPASELLRQVKLMTFSLKGKFFKSD